MQYMTTFPVQFGVLEASQLNRSHLGQTVRVTVDSSECVDLLSGVSHVADIGSSRRLIDEVPSYELGRTETLLTLLRFGTVQVAGNALVEVIDD
jgi:hypothetical protein